MLEFKELHKSFDVLEVLKGVSAKIEQGSITSVLGPNGSGKTTLIKMFLGMVKPDKGDIIFKENSILEKWEYRNDVSYLPQIAQFPENLTVNELIDLIKDIRNSKSKEKELIKLFELESHLEKKIKHLSGGTKQKVNIVLAFMFDNPILVLDEPSTGLDPVALLNLKTLITEEKKNGKTILVTTHIMSLVEEISDRIVFLLEGRVYFHGTKNELIDFAEESNLEKSIAKLLKDNNA